MSEVLQGKVVFITGAARGIGAGVAAEAARRGARVALCGLEPDELAARIQELGGDHAWFEADVTDSASVGAAVEATVQRFGRIDIVVSNAGIGTYGTIEKGDPAAWIRTIEVNLNGGFRTAHATIPHLIASRGYFCAIASVASYAPLAGMSSYTASKAGIESMVGALRHEVGFRGVACGTVHPSWIDTDLTRETQDDLSTFREMRANLPWPLRSTTSLATCSTAIVDGIEKRSRRIHVPGSVAMVYWLRSLVTSAAGDRVAAAQAAAIVPRMEAEIAALGRSSSRRTSTINHLGEEHPRRARHASGA